MSEILYGNLLEDLVIPDPDGLNGHLLLEQICLRLDRHFPTAETEAAKLEASQSVRLLITDWAYQLDSIGFPEKAQVLMEMIE